MTDHTVTVTHLRRQHRWTGNCTCGYWVTADIEHLVRANVDLHLSKHQTPQRQGAIHQ